MSFLHPLALLGLAAAAIPVLLHLLERRTPPELDFPPVRYLSDAERRSARRLRLRHLLLLVLRTALIVAVVLAGARPLVPARAGGVHQPTALVVILDNSPSSAAVVDGRPTLAGLRAAARASLLEATASDRLWLMLADGSARAGSREGLLAVVESVGVDTRRLDVARATAEAARLVDAEPLAAREVHVLSDLQLTALAAGRADVPQGMRVLALAPPEAQPNRGVASARAAEGAVAVTIGGSPDAGAGVLTVRWRGRDAGRAVVKPGETVSVPLPPSPSGWWVGEAELEPDELRVDDRRPFVRRVAPPAGVTAAAEAGPFVAAALAVLREGGRVAEGSEVVIGERPGPGTSVVVPPADAALLGQLNRALGARGVRWRFGAAGTPGALAAPDLPMLHGVAVARRLRLDGPAGDTAAVLARVNGEPWLLRDGSTVLVGSRLDTAWTALPAEPAFVPFVDALVNRVARGEAAPAEVEGPPGIAFDVRGPDTVRATVSGPDPRESNLRRADGGAVRRALGGRLLSEADFAAARFGGTRHVDLSGLLLLVALLVAAAELGVATLRR